MGTGLEEPLCKGILVTHPGCMFLRSLLTVPSGQWRCSTLILVTPVILSSVQNQNYSAHSFLVTLHQTSWSVSVHICMLIFNADGVGLLGRFLKLSFCIATPSLEVCATTASSHPTFPEFWSHFLDFMKLLCFPWHLSSALWSGMHFQAESPRDTGAHLICFLLSRITVLYCLLFKVWKRLYIYFPLVF